MTDHMISIVVRTYNESKHIGDLLKKLSQQDYDNYEVIVVDSESTDNTRQIASDYGANIVSIRKQDFNYSYASNMGVQHAKGDIICFLSGHSIPVKDTYLSDINHIFNRNNNIAACYGDVVALPDGSWIEKCFNQLGYLKNKLKGIKSHISLETTIHPGIFSCSNAAARKELLLKHPFKEELGSGGEDIEVAYRMIKEGFVIAQDPEMLVMHSHGLGFCAFAKQYRNWQNMYQNVLTYIEKSNSDNGEE